jgi:hypothetical protein
MNEKRIDIHKNELNTPNENEILAEDNIEDNDDDENSMNGRASSSSSSLSRINSNDEEEEIVIFSAKIEPKPSQEAVKIEEEQSIANEQNSTLKLNISNTTINEVMDDLITKIELEPPSNGKPALETKIKVDGNDVKKENENDLKEANNNEAAIEADTSHEDHIEEEKKPTINYNNNNNKRRRTAQENLESQQESNNIIQSKKRNLNNTISYKTFSSINNSNNSTKPQRSVSSRSLNNTQSSTSTTLITNENIVKKSPSSTTTSTTTTRQSPRLLRSSQSSSSSTANKESSSLTVLTSSKSSSSVLNSPEKSHFDSVSSTNNKLSFVSIQTLSNGRKIHMCEKCGIEFTSTNSVIRHQEKSCLRVKVINMPAAVKINSKSSKKTAAAHSSCLSEESMRKKCPICSSTFFNTHRLSIHIYKHHKNLLGSVHKPPASEAVRLNEIQLKRLNEKKQVNEFGEGEDEEEEIGEEEEYDYEEDNSEMTTTMMDESSEILNTTNEDLQEMNKSASAT